MCKGLTKNVDQNRGAFTNISICFRYSEIENVDFEKMKPKDPKKAVGHFTQLVWKATTHMGIGYASNEKKCWIVAQYVPGGNVIGMKNYRNNVKKPLQ